MKHSLATTILFLSFSISVSGCMQHSEAKKAVKSILNDPGSAEFQELNPGKEKGDVCGKVNAKNRMGGFAGATPFVYEAKTNSATLVESPTDADFAILSHELSTSRGNSNTAATNIVLKCMSLQLWEEKCSTRLPIRKHPRCEPESSNPSDAMRNRSR